MIASIIAPVAAAGACSSSSKDHAVESPDATIAASDGGDDASDADLGDASTACDPVSLYVDAALPDGAIDCDVYNLFSCGIPSGVAAPANDCFFAFNDCPTVCPGLYFFNCRTYGNWCLDGSILTSEDGGITLDDGSVVSLDPPIVECATCPNGAGRRPRGLATPVKTRRSATALGRYFADVAHLEKASVSAFRMLRGDLVKLGAPRELARSAERAARDEARHARTTARLARRHGDTPARVVVREEGAARSLEQLALENAVEGCVRETFGALVASWQAAHAEDADVARAMQTIAADETRHAALAWGIAKWAEKKLNRDARRRVALALNEAIRQLEASASQSAHPEVVRLAGVPNSRTHRAMLRELRRNLWT